MVHFLYFFIFLYYTSFRGVSMLNETKLMFSSLTLSFFQPDQLEFRKISHPFHFIHLSIFHSISWTIKVSLTLNLFVKGLSVHEIFINWQDNSFQLKKSKSPLIFIRDRFSDVFSIGDQTISRLGRKRSFGIPPKFSQTQLQVLRVINMYRQILLNTFKNLSLFSSSWNVNEDQLRMRKKDRN